MVSGRVSTAISSPIAMVASVGIFPAIVITVGVAACLVTLAVVLGRDAQRHGQNGWAWGVGFILAPLIVGIVYLIQRGGQTLSRRSAERLPYVIAVVVMGGVIAIALSNSGGTSPFGWALLVVVPIGLVIVFGRMARQSKRAAPVRDSVLADSVIAQFSRVWVQLNPGTTKSVTLKGGPFGVEVLVKTHSFEVGPAPPLRGSFRYYFEAGDVDMEASRQRFSNFFV